MTLECSMLYVKDFARMREFYGNVLQSKPVNTQWIDRWALFEIGGTGFALHAIPAAAGAHADLPSPREHSPVKLIFAVQDVPSERARLEAMGVGIRQQAWQEPAESCDCVDPEGNIFQIAARSRLSHLFGRAST